MVEDVITDATEDKLADTRTTPASHYNEVSFPIFGDLADSFTGTAGVLGKFGGDSGGVGFQTHSTACDNSTKLLLVPLDITLDKIPN